MEEHVFCQCCSETIILDEDSYSQCDDCQGYFCSMCDSQMVDRSSYCTTEDCYYCRKGSCFNNRTENTYCVVCVPESVVEANKKYERDVEEAINNFNSIQEGIPTRKVELTLALKDVGVELRKDSKLCRKYIQDGDGDVECITKRMCEMKYLFEYCNIREVVKHLETEYCIILENGDIPDFDVFSEAEQIVLHKVQGYPKVFPWQIERELHE